MVSRAAGDFDGTTSPVRSEVSPEIDRMTAVYDGPALGIGEPIDLSKIKVTRYYVDGTSDDELMVLPTMISGVALVDGDYVNWNNFGANNGFKIAGSQSALINIGLKAAVFEVNILSLAQRIAAAGGTTETITIYSDETLEPVNINIPDTHITLVAAGTVLSHNKHSANYLHDDAHYELRLKPTATVTPLPGGGGSGTLSVAGSLFTVGAPNNKIVSLSIGKGIFVSGGYMSHQVGGTQASDTLLSNNVPLIEVYGTLTLKDDAVISNHKSTGSGTIRINSGVFNMDGGKIEDNTSNIAGAVYLVGSTMNMKGGTISGNTGTDDNVHNGAGGVSVGGHLASSTFNMSGGNISGNNGDGVYVGWNLSYSTYTLSTFNMSGGTISLNTGNGVGGALDSSSSIVMSGGTISGNTGCGIVGDNVNVSAGNISGNTAELGGGVYIANGKTLNKTGGTIYGNSTGANANTASNKGHAVYWAKSPAQKVDTDVTGNLSTAVTNVGWTAAN